MQRTRREILNILKRKGSATLDDLATGVGLVPVTVRAHLNVLERDDLVKYEEVRGRVGRPYYVYSLTEEAEDLFPKTYHVLASRLLDSVTAVGGPECTARVIEQMAASWARERQDRLASKDLAGRVAEAARIRSEEGAWAEWEATDGGYLLTQYNCGCPRVAERHPDVVCAVELEYLRRLISPDLRRVQWVHEGARACVYMIPEPAT